MTEQTWIRAVSRACLMLMVVGVTLAVLTACGGEERLSREEFDDHVQAMDRRASEQYELLSAQAMQLEPEELLTDEIRQAMTEYAAAVRRAADELEKLTPPEEAEEEAAALIRALRQRADAFESAAATEGMTLEQIEADGSATRAGDAIDRAFEQLRAEGFLAD